MAKISFEIKVISLRYFHSHWQNYVLGKSKIHFDYKAFMTRLYDNSEIHSIWSENSELLILREMYL